MNIIEKIIKAHLIEGCCRPGEEVKIRIDQTLCQDATGTMAFLELEAIGVDRVKTELSVQYIDHNTSQFGPENANDHLYLQSVCSAKGVLFSRAGNGICHQVHLERFGVPGKTLLGSDSHTPTGGGIGMLAIGAGGLDVALAMAGEPFKLTFPAVTGIRLTGSLKPWVSAKDVILKVLSILGSKGNVGTAVEYFGPGVATLSVPERATITNMGAELGVTTSIFPSDETTLAFLKAEGRADSWTPLAPDPDAQYQKIIEIDLSSVEPMAACPSNPGNVKPLLECAGIPVGQVLIGSCTNSSLKDLQLVAAMLKGRKIHPDISLGIAPGSRQVLQMLSEDGSLAIMLAAGCRILESACGPCIGQGFSPASGTVSVRTFNRNFLNRTGTKNDQCYLVSPETAVATALTGKLSDPRTVAADLGLAYPQWQMPIRFRIDDSMIQQPAPLGTAVEIIRKETIGEPPHGSPLPENLDGEVLLHLEDKITTDHIMPAGANLKYRSNIPRYAQVVFECFNREGEPTFAERAAAVRDQGRAGIIVAGESYGQGSSREHAAICPMYLGVRVVIAFSIERIHAANLINFGILPLQFSKAEDYQLLTQGTSIKINNLPAQIRAGTSIAAECEKNGVKQTITLQHQLSNEDAELVIRGGKLA
ncbi:MAG: aconitate hydratase [Lentisphaerae bacterium]|jgi:aconitate hydratase|nr:aconitate hydratase [Lentisphaerota bacterium]